MIDENPESAAAVKDYFDSVNAAIETMCPELEDKIGVCLTMVMTYVAQMVKDDPTMNGSREIAKIANAIKLEWRDYCRLEKMSPNKPRGASLN